MTESGTGHTFCKLLWDYIPAKLGLFYEIIKKYLCTNYEEWFIDIFVCNLNIYVSRLVNINAPRYRPEDATIGSIMRGLYNNNVDVSGNALGMSHVRLNFGKFVWQFMEFRYRLNNNNVWQQLWALSMFWNFTECVLFCEILQQEISTHRFFSNLLMTKFGGFLFLLSF